MNYFIHCAFIRYSIFNLLKAGMESAFKDFEDAPVFFP
jgi:hypothetical protein